MGRAVGGWLALTLIAPGGGPGEAAAVETPPRQEAEAIAQEVLDRLGVPEELRDSEAARDLVEEEATLAERRAMTQGRPTDAPAAGETPPAVRPWVGPPRRPAWLSLLPQLTVTATQGEDRRAGPDGARQRRRKQLVLLAELPLGRPAGPPPPGPVAGSAQPTAEAAPLAWPDPGPRACLSATRAAAVAHALVEPERARSLAVRAGRAAWLPELRVRVERRLGRAESLDVKPTVSGDALGLDTADDVRYEVRATWDLPRLVFNPEEVAAHHQALRTAEMRREIESQVHRLYFEWRRWLAPSPVAPTGESASPLVEGERLLRLEELGADLDALSAGAFSRCLARPPGEVQP